MNTSGSVDTAMPVKKHLAWTADFVPWPIFLVAIAARCVPAAHVLSGSHIYWYDPDCYIRFRKILIYLQSFPSTSVYDYFEGFPVGTGVLSPPTMEYIIAALVYPFQSLPHVFRILEVAVALLPVLLGACTVLLLYRFMMEHFGRLAAATAAVILALYPPFVEATVIGRFDNEMIEPLMLLAAFRLYLSTYHPEDRSITWLAVGIMSVAYLSFWRGAVFPLTLIGMDVIARMISHRHDAARVRHLRKGSVLLYGAAALSVTLICITDIWGTRETFSYNIISWFHVALFVTAAILTEIIAEFTATRTKTPLRARGAYTAFLISLLVILSAFLSKSLLQGIEIISGGNVWIDAITQYRRGLSGSGLLVMYGGLTFIVPLLYVLARRYAHELLPWWRFLFLWSLFMTGAALSRARFAEYLGINVAMLAGLAVAYIDDAFRRRTIRHQSVLRIAALIAVIGVQSSTYAYFLQLYQYGSSYDIRGDLEHTLQWLRANTPPAGDPYRPDRKPSYGVLARWDFGGYIESLAERPVLATNYGRETHGVEEVARFFLAHNEEEMEAVLQRNRIRYIFVDKMTSSLSMYAAVLGRNTNFFMETWDPQRKTTVYLPTRETYSIISSRLFFADGTNRRLGDVLFQPVEGVRLIFESSSPANVVDYPWEIKRYKVFEYGGGVSLQVRGKPGKTVKIMQEIETNQGRTFTYVKEKQIQGNGMVDFKVLYSRKTAPGTTGAISPLTITSTSQARKIEIRELDVASRKNMMIEF